MLAPQARGSLGRPFLILIPVFTFWVVLQVTLYRVAFKINNAPVDVRQPDEGARALSNGAFRGIGAHVDSGIMSHASSLAEQHGNTSSIVTDSVTSETTTTTTPAPLPTVVAAAAGPPRYSKKEWYELEWTYLADEKDWSYNGSQEWLTQFPAESRLHFNSLATFPNVNSTRMHGLVGIYSNGTRAWTPAPPPPPAAQYPGGQDEALKNGGFYMNLSDSLPLDREPADGRDPVCKTQIYNYTELDEVSIIITFYNEAMSTLLRSVHSVLNYTPPPLLREIILVDDHSNSTDCLPGSWLYDYLKLLPKVKLTRLPDRRGLVWARLVGAKLSQAPVLVVLDSHIEVNEGWLEPQLQRLKESPKSIVFPQIMAIDSVDFTYQNSHGIGCFLSFKWVMQEKASLTGVVKKPDAIPSPSMAGGLFAVRKDWFWELGGYDEEFCMWGAENVEMGFRVWMCGGRLECTPCARVYHIYRKGGHAYKSPPECLWKNRLRTARLWTDEFYQLAEQLTHHPGFDIGSFDAVLEMKERLQCKNFKWFLKNVHPTLELQDMSQIRVMGEFRNVKHPYDCIDTLSHTKAGEDWGFFSCHAQGGTQGFIYIDGSAKIRSFLDESKCLGNKLKLTDCKSEENHISLPGDKTIRWKAGTSDELCLGIFLKADVPGGKEVKFSPCDAADEQLQWKYSQWTPDPNFKLPDFSPEYKAKRAAALPPPASDAQVSA